MKDYSARADFSLIFRVEITHHFGIQTFMHSKLQFYDKRAEFLHGVYNLVRLKRTEPEFPTV